MIVCIGDSLTVGQYLADDELPWPSLIIGHEIVAAGVNSDTTRLGLERFPRDVQQREPATVVIQFGHNDCNVWESDRGLHRVSPKAYAANLEEMVTRCRKFGAEPLLCTLTPSFRTERHAYDVEYYDDILRDVAWATGTALVDVRAVFLGRDDLLLDDRIHLNAEGHRLYAATVQTVLDR